MKGKNILQLIVCIVIPLVVGAGSGFITRNETGDGTWFASLIKPSFNPPNSLFGPVWTSLYLLMGISLYLIWTNSEGYIRKKAVFIFSMQLFFNFWWSILFFKYHFLAASVVDILAVWICIGWMIIEFKKIKPIAAYLQLPYILWVSFATLLNASIWILNR